MLHLLLGAVAAADSALVENGMAKKLGCSEAQIYTTDALGDSKLTGTLFANDKSKGVAFLVNLDTNKYIGVELPLVYGNHEAALSPDGGTFAVPHYETTRDEGKGEGGGTPGEGVSLLDVDTGLARIMDGKANPFRFPKPHDAWFTPEGDLLVTAQLANGVVRYTNPLGEDGKEYSAQGFELENAKGAGCDTPHLLRVIPDSTLAVTGCRCTNPTSPADCVGSLAVFDYRTGAAKAFPVGSHSEAIAVTKDGDMWVGSKNSDFLMVFGFQGKAKKLSNVALVKKIENVRAPLRLAYDPVNDVVAASLFFDLEDETDAPNLVTFSASTQMAVEQVNVRASASGRGKINFEGLFAVEMDGRGYFYAGGFDNQALVLLDALTLEVVAEVALPRCATPAGLCEPTVVSKAEATSRGLSGANNWAGGVCPGTLRTAWDRRWVTLDGFNYSPMKYPKWAGGQPKLSSLKVYSEFCEVFGSDDKLCRLCGGKRKGKFCVVSKPKCKKVKDDKICASLNGCVWAGDGGCAGKLKLGDRR